MGGRTRRIVGSSEKAGVEFEAEKMWWTGGSIGMRDIQLNNLLPQMDKGEL